MSASTFSWTPSKGFQQTTKPRVINSQFGDGYSLRIADGINNIVHTWRVQFNSVSVQTSEEILNFLVQRAGVTPFLWTPPGSLNTYTVVCPEWNVMYESHISRSVEATFTQVFDAL
jgi:phage-related protein